MAIISPSLLAADFTRLGEMVKMVEDAGVEWLHLDIMDGHFVPNLTFGPGVVKALRPKSKLFFDAHLMIDNPEKYIKSFYDAGSELITVHSEVLCDQCSILKDIKALGIKAGISVNPGTPIEHIEEALSDCDLVLVMSVHPGFGGQKFMPEVLSKVQWLVEMREKYGYKYLIEIDGGITIDNAPMAIKSGVDVLVAGTAIFGAVDINKAVSDMKKIY